MGAEKQARAQNEGFWRISGHDRMPKFCVQRDTTWASFFQELGQERRYALLSRFNPKDDRERRDILEDAHTATQESSRYALFRILSIMMCGQAAVNIRTGEVVATGSLPVTDAHRDALQAYGMAHVDVPYTYTLPSGKQLEDHDEFIAIGRELLDDIVPSQLYRGAPRVALMPRADLTAEQQETRENLFPYFWRAMKKLTEKATTDDWPQEKMITAESLLLLILRNKNETMEIFEAGKGRSLRPRLPRYGEQPIPAATIHEPTVAGVLDPVAYALELNGAAEKPKAIEELLDQLQLLALMTPSQLANLDTDAYTARKRDLVNGLVTTLQQAQTLTNDEERLRYLQQQYSEWYITPLDNATAFSEETLISHFLVGITYSRLSLAEADRPTLPQDIQDKLARLVDKK